MSFWEGFANQLNQNIINRKERIAERNAEQRRMLRQEALQRQATVQKQKEAVGATVSTLRALKLEDRKIAALIKGDPRMAARVADLAVQNGMTGEDINAFVEINEEFQFDKPLDQIIEEAVPGFASMPDADPNTKKVNILQSIFGFDDGTAEARMLGEEIIPGVTGSQVIASRGTPTIATGDGSIGLNMETLQGNPYENMNSAQIRKEEEKVSSAIDFRIRQEISSLKESMGEGGEDRADIDPDIIERIRLLERFDEVQDGTLADKLYWLQENGLNTDPNILRAVQPSMGFLDYIGYGNFFTPMTEEEAVTSGETATGVAPTGVAPEAEGQPSGELIIEDGEIEGSPRPKRRREKKTVIAEKDPPVGSSPYKVEIEDGDGRRTIELDEDGNVVTIISISPRGKVESLKPGDEDFEQSVEELLRFYDFKLRDPIMWGTLP